MFPTAARAAGTVLVKDAFDSHEVLGDYTVGGSTFVGGTHVDYSPCLTASGDLDLRPVPGCEIGQTAIEHPDPSGEGALRLTDNGHDRSSFILYQDKLPLEAGLDIHFEMFVYARTVRPPLPLRGGDGISFFLQNAEVRLDKAGAFGGSLGYAQKRLAGGAPADVPGVAGGYVGVGFDEFGNYANDNEGRGHGCGGQELPVHGAFPDRVSVRGPGDALDHYCLLQSSENLDSFGGISYGSAHSRNVVGVRRKVHIVIDPLDRPNAHIKVWIAFQQADGSTREEEVLDHVLPSGRPAEVRFGFASSTGDQTNVHEIRLLTIDSIEALPVLRLTKTNDGPFDAGGLGHFTLTASVHDAPARAGVPITVTDRIPVGHVEGEASGTGWRCEAQDRGQGSVVTCTYVPTEPVLANTDLPPITVPVRFPTTASCLYTNQARVDSEDNAGTPEESSASDQFGVRPIGVPDSGQYAPGRPVEIPVLANDLGDLSPSSVHVSAALAGTAVWEPAPSGGVLVYTPDPGSTATEHLTYTASDACHQQIPPTDVEITPNEPSPPAAPADLQVTKTVSPRATHIGGLLTYTITVRNAGLSLASNVTYTDTLGGLAQLVRVRTDTGSCTPALPLICQLGPLGAGAHATIILEVRAEQAGELTNVGVATAAGVDSTPADAHVSVDATVAPPSAQLALRKVATRRTLRRGQSVTFVIAVTARPPVDAHAVRVCDRVPALLRIVSAPGARRSGQTLCWTIQRLPVRTRRHFQFLAHARSVPGVTQLENVATASAGNAARRLTASASVVILPSPHPPATTG